MDQHRWRCDDIARRAIDFGGTYRCLDHDKSGCKQNKCCTHDQTSGVWCKGARGIMSKRGWLLVRDAPLARFSSVTLAAYPPPGFQAGVRCHPDYRDDGRKLAKILRAGRPGRVSYGWLN